MRTRGSSRAHPEGLLAATLLAAASMVSACGERELFVRIAAGENHSCGILSTGRVACWGEGTTSVGCLERRILGDQIEHSLECGQAAPPEGTFEQIALGFLSSCAIDGSGHVQCWGPGCDGLGWPACVTIPPPEAGFVELAGGGGHYCARKVSGEVVCWGGKRGEQRPAPPGVFEHIAAGASRTCGIRPGGAVECWGRPLSDKTSTEDGSRFVATATTPPPGIAFRRLAVGGGHVCGITTDGTATCWGGAFRGTHIEPGPYEILAAGGDNTCGLRAADRSMTCRGKLAYNFPTPGGAGYLDVAVAEHACAITVDGRAFCWGGGPGGEGDAPDLPLP